MRRLLRYALPVLLLAAAALVGFTAVVSWPIFDEQVAPLPLTLPPREVGVAIAQAGEQTLLLTGGTAETVTGIPLAGSPLEAAAAGAAALQARSSGEPVTVPLDSLVLPVPGDIGQHIAAGANYTSHAEEVSVEEAFIFPKLSRPTLWSAPTPPGRRLDYEVELCAVALTELVRWEPARIGFVLCGDFTDRWLLVRNIDPSGAMGLTGFSEGKGGAGRLPVGPWLIVPHDADAFPAQVELRLSVDGQLRQRASAGEMLWSPEEIVTQALAACGSDFRAHGQPIDWPGCERIPAGTLLLTGTPAGVVFKLANVWAPWPYLRPGQTVIGEASWLGRTVTTVQ